MNGRAGLPTLRWLGDGELEVDGQRYAVTANVPEMHALESTSDRLVLAKNRAMVEHIYQGLAAGPVDHVVELGIFKGGSTAFLLQVLRPRKLVAIDVQPEPVGPLEAFVADRGLDDVVSLHWGVDQADRARLSAIVEEEFGGEQLDLVIDDASHQYDMARASVEVLLPRLRPGGRYVVEDWAWAHFDEEIFNGPDALWADRPGLSNLIVEMMLVIGSYPDILSEAHLDHHSSEFVRGPRELSEPVDLSRLYLNRDKAFRPVL